MSDKLIVDTFSDETRETYRGSHLWKPWMETIRLRQAETLDDVFDFLEWGRVYQNICWDIETKSLNPDPSEIVGHSIAFTPDEALYIPVRHVPNPELNLDPNIVFKLITELIKIKTLVVYNLRFEGAFLWNAGIHLETNTERVKDAMLYRWLYNSDDKRINLKDSAFNLCGFEMLEIREVPGVSQGKKKSRKSPVDFSQSLQSDATLYAAADVVMTLRVLDKTEPFVVDSGQSVITEIEHELLRVLIRMEHNRANISRAILAQGKKDLLRWSDIVASEIYEKNGSTPFNLASPGETAAFLRKQDVPLPLTATGKYSTDAKQMALLASQFPIVERVSLWRSLMKEVGTYVNPLLEHTIEGNSSGAFNIVQSTTATGRCSSKKGQIGDPRYFPINVQSLPAASAYVKAPARLVANPPEEDMKRVLFYGGEPEYVALKKKKDPDENFKNIQMENGKVINRFELDLGAIDED